MVTEVHGLASNECLRESERNNPDSPRSGKSGCCLICLEEIEMSTRPASVDIDLKSVMVASDFTEASSKPLRHAISIARHFHANFYLAHVVSSIGLAIAGAEALELASTAAQKDVANLERKLVERG